MCGIAKDGFFLSEKEHQMLFKSKRFLLSIASLLVIFSCLQAKADEELYKKLQDISVTVKSGYSEGSGVIITREVRVGPNKTEKINFVWTAGHVIDNLRLTKRV